jgi:hypothetical protein
VGAGFVADGLEKGGAVMSELRIHSETAWNIASKFSGILASETRDLAALIDDALAAERTWRPIETAPKTGEFIWLASHAFMRIGFWSQERWADMERAKAGGPCDLLFFPTHWQPLPAPPEDK